jgi:hypothetical protein
MSFELIPLKPEQHTVTFVPRLTLELPFFNLTVRHKNIPKVIKYEGRDEAGRPIRWEVYQDTSEEIGAPAVEAHEVWYLLVKPSIDASRRPDGSIPEIIPLGGIRECLRKVGWTAGGHQARELLKVLTQISFAGCVADLWVPTGEQDQEGKTRFLQIKGRFSRMSVYAIGEHHLTEEELTQRKFDFELADVVYIRLDPLEAKLQQMQDRRILDNQYLFSVSPIARRWYELMAAKIFGVVSNNGQFCEIRYSWYLKHHHTLKRYSERFRVVQQMKRVVSDHMESGYLSKVEYRAVKEPDQEIDFIIRYYPGTGAKESNTRIQTYIRDKRNRRGGGHARHTLRPGNAPAQTEKRALSIITSEHHSLITALMLQFRINPLKATDLVSKSKETVRMQVEAWPFRDTKPRNLAGWMIQAIESNYDVPAAYHECKSAQMRKEDLEAIRDVINGCGICDNSGFRYIKNQEYPNGAMRQCTHEPVVENGITLGARNTTRSDDNQLRGKLPV